MTTRMAGAVLVFAALGACAAHPLGSNDTGASGGAGTNGTAGAAGTTGGAGTTGEAGTTGTAGSAGGAGAGGAANVSGGAGTAGTGTAGTAGTGVTVQTEATLTEWRLPFGDPFQIATVGNDVVYLDKSDQQMLGWLQVETGTVTEWPLSHPSTSPAGIEVRPSDGAVFSTSGTTGEIVQFDLRTEVLMRWLLPLGLAEPGPWGLSFDAGTGVYFSAFDANGTVIGRLDTATGRVDTWAAPDASVGRVVTASDGTVFISAGVLGEAPRQIVRLDPATGIFTTWPKADQPLLPVASDGSGGIFFQESREQVARLDPRTGRLTEWPLGSAISECLLFRAGRVFLGGERIWALDPTVAGHESTLPASTTAPVKPLTAVITATVLPPLKHHTERATTTQQIVHAQVSNGVETWTVPGQPRMMAAAPGAVFFTEEVRPVIARLAR